MCPGGEIAVVRAEHEVRMAHDRSGASARSAERVGAVDAHRESGGEVGHLEQTSAAGAEGGSDHGVQRSVRCAYFGVGRPVAKNPTGRGSTSGIGHDRPGRDRGLRVDGRKKHEVIAERVVHTCVHRACHDIASGERAAVVAYKGHGPWSDVERGRAGRGVRGLEHVRSAIVKKVGDGGRGDGVVRAVRSGIRLVVAGAVGYAPMDVVHVDRCASYKGVRVERGRGGEQALENSGAIVGNDARTDRVAHRACKGGVIDEQAARVDPDEKIGEVVEDAVEVLSGGRHATGTVGFHGDGGKSVLVASVGRRRGERDVVAVHARVIERLLEDLGRVGRAGH